MSIFFPASLNSANSAPPRICWLTQAAFSGQHQCDTKTVCRFWRDGFRQLRSSRRASASPRTDAQAQRQRQGLSTKGRVLTFRNNWFSSSSVRPRRRWWCHYHQRSRSRFHCHLYQHRSVMVNFPAMDAGIIPVCFLFKLIDNRRDHLPGFFNFPERCLQVIIFNDSRG